MSPDYDGQTLTLGEVCQALIDMHGRDTDLWPKTIPAEAVRASREYLLQKKNNSLNPATDRQSVWNRLMRNPCGTQRN